MLRFALRAFPAVTLITTALVATPPATAADPPCAAAAAGMTPVLGLDLSAQANGLDQTPPYSFDDTAKVAGGFDRVGYCLELDDQWVWTGMEPFIADPARLGLPTRPGQITRQRVDDLEVRSNVAGVATGSGLTGYLEMWPNQYGAAAAGQIAGASSTTYDTDDSINATLGYGSFQVHNATGSPVLSVNTFTQENPMSVGIGAQPAGHPDWTFAGNAGQVTDPRVRSVRLEVSSGGRTWTLLAAGEPAAVSGDVYVVQGQSNAQANQFVGSANGEQSPYLRGFGSPSPDRTISEADRGWHYAHGDVSYQSGSAGQWALPMGRRLVATYKVPVALLNGAHGGQPIAFFQRNDAAPGDGATNHGRLRQRLVAAGALGTVRGVLWYQGESDNDNAAVHVTGFGALLEDRRSEFGATKYYVHQVRTSPCGNSTTIALRDAQRRLGDSHRVVLLSTTALKGHDGCHYAYAAGYRDLGDHAFATVARDLYGGPGAGVSAPNPVSATASGNRITVRLRTSDPLTVEPGAEADFRVTGAAVTVSAVGYSAGSLVLTLSGPAAGATGVSYLGHLRSGPVITNATGAGLLAFDQPLR